RKLNTYYGAFVKAAYRREQGCKRGVYKYHRFVLFVRIRRKVIGISYLNVIAAKDAFWISVGIAIEMWLEGQQ
ncbi:hypothetical protein A2U01_0098393, partial [Trifolium medium]|nr:hypothetical protein [Trifolium medium]